MLKRLSEIREVCRERRGGETPHPSPAAPPSPQGEGFWMRQELNAVFFQSCGVYATLDIGRERVVASCDAFAAAQAHRLTCFAAPPSSQAGAPAWEP